jgi:hypothetical protein
MTDRGRDRVLSGWITRGVRRRLPPPYPLTAHATEPAWVSAHRLTHGLCGGLLSSAGSAGSEKGSSSLPPGNGTPCSSGRVKLRMGRPRGPRISRAPRISQSRRRRGRPLILVGPMVVLPAALLRLRSGTRHRAGATRIRRATDPATVLLVLLSEHQGVLPDRADMRRGVDQGPPKASVEDHSSSTARPITLRTTRHPHSPESDRVLMS